MKLENAVFNAEFNIEITVDSMEHKEYNHDRKNKSSQK